MVNTKVIRQPSQSPSLLSSPLPLSPPPSFLSLLSLSSSHYPKFSNSLSFSFFPFSNPSSSTACLSTRTRHPPHSFYFYSPHPRSQFPIRHSLSASLSISLFSPLYTWFVILSGGFRLLLLLRRLRVVHQLGSIRQGLLASLEYLVGVVFFLFHVSISSGIGRTEL